VKYYFYKQIETEGPDSYALVGSIHPHLSHKMWKHCNGEISELTDDDCEVVNSAFARVVVEPDTLYASALNEKNARKRFDKLIKENSKP
jgi:hypothetical protein